MSTNQPIIAEYLEGSRGLRVEDSGRLSTSIAHPGHVYLVSVHTVGGEELGEDSLSVGHIIMTGGPVTGGLQPEFSTRGRGQVRGIAHASSFVWVP